MNHKGELMENVFIEMNILFLSWQGDRGDVRLHHTFEHTHSPWGWGADTDSSFPKGEGAFSGILSNNWGS